jgi:hypothetical protein
MEGLLDSITTLLLLRFFLFHCIIQSKLMKQYKQITVVMTLTTLLLLRFFLFHCIIQSKLMKQYKQITVVMTLREDVFVVEFYCVYINQLTGLVGRLFLFIIFYILFVFIIVARVIIVIVTRLMGL